MGLTEEEFNKEHSVCPRCFTKNYAMTCVGIICSPNDWKNDNRVRCDCGFVGTVEDCVPDPNEKK